MPRSGSFQLVAGFSVSLSPSPPLSSTVPFCQPKTFLLEAINLCWLHRHATKEKKTNWTLLFMAKIICGLIALHFFFVKSVQVCVQCILCGIVWGTSRFWGLFIEHIVENHKQCCVIKCLTQCTFRWDGKYVKNVLLLLFLWTFDGPWLGRNQLKNTILCTTFFFTPMHRCMPAQIAYIRPLWLLALLVHLLAIYVCDV